MSNELSDLLHGAAAAPSGPPDVPGARRRGRRLRAERFALSGLAIVVIIAIGSAAVAGIAARGGDTPAPPATGSVEKCTAPSLGALQPWTASAHPPANVPHVVSSDGNVVAVVFGPLSSPPRAGFVHNKILWIMRPARDGQALTITATLAGAGLAPVRVVRPADSSPGEIYPTIVDVPRPGCWHLVLGWNGHRSTMNLRWTKPRPAPPTTTATSTTTTSTTVPATNAAPTTCRTSALSLSLGPPIGSAGHFNYEIAFRNTGATACVMDGFPGVSFLDAAGHQIGVPAGRNTLQPAPVTVAPGASAYAHIAVVDTSVQNCPPAAAQQIRVYPPNETASAVVAVSGLQVCSDQTVGSTVDPVLDHPLG